MENTSNCDTSSPQERQNVSFKFTKITSKTLTGNRLSEAISSKQPKDYVISVAKNEIRSTLPRDERKELVIPLIKKNNWRVPKNENDNITEEDKLRELAVQELLKETSEQNEKWENRDGQDYTISIPLIMQNKIPEGYETDEKMDVSLRPDESKLEDYEQVPVEQYGLAMLRGMGWKDGAAIGMNNKKCVVPVQVQLRPKGLGLGADISALQKSKVKKDKDEKLTLVKSAYFKVLQGSYKGHYGQVLGLDEENARVIARIHGNEKSITLPEFYVDVVSKKEYEKEIKVINRTTYEKYKKEHQHREEREAKEGKYQASKEENCDDNSSKRKSSKRDGHSKKKRHDRDRSTERHSHHSSKQKDSKCWVRPQLRVRFIDDAYKTGKYFNQKLVVMDVLSPDNCTCKTENDHYLENISASSLETVVPRSEPGYVMIVQGKYSGEVCTILNKDKSNCTATVQLLSDRDKAMKLEYDAICEYVGDISIYD